MPSCGKYMSKQEFYLYMWLAYMCMSVRMTEYVCARLFMHVWAKPVHRDREKKFKTILQVERESLMVAELGN